ncbi:putative transcriptional regulatory protein [Tolypocladium ophioglossoides CBS 100239]|uniref:Putative transcriptional regulatory protein n=1 Tax=Tolypocladium ophioglossoides (strain CBS 100239) TaxID=1163406 RepID=A0A0L0NAE4_TOLOC|nr:putative transcriptional regulatory protein [Tolypocladium ophioglossoides CBS 100239]
MDDSGGASDEARGATESQPWSRYIRSRVANACDGCKARKVKCDGKLPCGYCAGRRRSHACHYSPQRRRRPARGAGGEASSATAVTSASGTAAGAGAADDDTEVPREARLLCDAHGKLTFIGDCAPLSFFQSVRQLVTSRVGQNAFAPESSRYSVLENAPAGSGSGAGAGAAAREHGPHRHGMAPPVRPADTAGAVAAYLAATTSLVDLFDNGTLLDDLERWASLDRRRPDDAASVVNYLVLAIGRLVDDEALSRAYFEYARDRAYGTLGGSLGVGTVQAFALVTVYMLCSCQINGAFLFFGIAVRAAYSLGVHRTEVNARFGPAAHRQRDRLWKSLRVVDLFLSVSMGRPPATSDVDCTVPYRAVDGEAADLLDASVQILLITEGVVVQIYSRRRVSLQLAEGVSHQLRDWSVRWLRRLTGLLARDDAQAAGACQVLASYYYAVMLVSRPFLMYELCRRLSDGPAGAGTGAGAGTPALASGKAKLADACIDAASLMVEPIVELIDRGVLDGRVPLIVSWLFAASLVLGVGLLGGFGRVLEKHSRTSIRALDHFARSDGHAAEYSLVAQSLLATALEHLERRELQERRRRTESSSQLFGLMPSEAGSPGGPSSVPARSPAPAVGTEPHLLDRAFLPLGDVDSAFLGLTEGLLQTADVDYWGGSLGGEGDAGSALNLFPLLEAGGGIDLAHYLQSLPALTALSHPSLHHTYKETNNTTNNKQQTTNITGFCSSQMASFLSLPRELRDAILAHVLKAPHALLDPPATPADLRKEDRRTVSSAVSGAWGSSRAWFETQPAILSAPVRLVCRQFCTEVAEMTNRKSMRLPDYHLDLMYLTDGSLWPTWTCVPMLTDKVGTVHVTVRIFHCPAELQTPGERRDAPFFGGDGGPAHIVWLFYHTLGVFLQCGPRPWLGAGVRNHGPGMSMRRLVINVLSATEPGIVHVAYPASFDGFDRIRWDDPLMCIDRSGRSLLSDDDDEGVVAADLLARFLETEIRSLLGLSYHTFRYGGVLYEHIGEVEVRVNGEHRARMDLASLLAQAPFVEGFGPYAKVQWRRDFAEWIVEATRRRSAAGLALEPRGEMQRRLLRENGLLQACMEVLGEETMEEAGRGGAH